MFGLDAVMPMIDLDPGFTAHLANLGIALGTTGVVHIHPDTMVEPPVKVLGADIWRDRVAIGAFSYIAERGVFANATAGRYCSLGEGLQVGMARHPADWLTSSPVAYLRDFMNFESHFAADPDWQRELEAQDFDIRPATTIGNDVWIGTEVYLKDGITVGDGAIIGAHAVVTHDVPPYTIVVGSPARILRYRFDDALIERLLALRWWDYNILDFVGWDVRNVAGAISALEDAIAADIVRPYAPAPVNLVDEHARYCDIQRLLKTAAA